MIAGIPARVNGVSLTGLHQSARLAWCKVRLGTRLLGHDAILRVGYRALYQDYRNGNLQWDVTQHGPVVGASIRF